MESLPQPQYGSIEVLERALASDGHIEAPIFLRSCIEMGELARVTVSNFEDELIDEFCAALTGTAAGDPAERAVAARAVQFAKLAWRTYVAEDTQLYVPTAGDSHEAAEFVANLYDQRPMFELRHEPVVELAREMNVELDGTGEHSAFAVEVACLAFAALDTTAQLQRFHAGMDDGLKALFDDNK